MVKISLIDLYRALTPSMSLLEWVDLHASDKSIWINSDIAGVILKSYGEQDNIAYGIMAHYLHVLGVL